MTIASVTGSFAGTGQSSSVALKGKFNVSLSGFGTATVVLERSFDGTNWKVASRDSAGNAASYTADADIVGEEPESGVLYRLNCTAHSAGTITYRISQ